MLSFRSFLMTSWDILCSMFLLMLCWTHVHEQNTSWKWIEKTHLRLALVKIDFRQSIHLQWIHLGHKRLLNVYQSVFKRLTDAFQSFLSQINRLTNVCQSIVIFSQGMRFWRMETKVVKHKKSDFPEPVKLFSPFIQRFSALKTTFSKCT